MMKTSLVWLLFLSSSLIIRLSGTENITTGQELQEVDDGGESHVENITIELSVEPLPQAQPLVGTYPHDFQLLPSITRRSSFQESSEGHNYEEQGELSSNWSCVQQVRSTVTNCQIKFSNNRQLLPHVKNKNK